MLPAVPLLAVVMAIGLCRFSDSSIADIADRLLSVVSVAFFALGIFGLSVLWQNGLLAKHLAGLTILSLALLLIALLSLILLIRWVREARRATGEGPVV